VAGFEVGMGQDAPVGTQRKRSRIKKVRTGGRG